MTNVIKYDRIPGSLNQRRAEIVDLEREVAKLPNQLDVNEGLTHHFCEGLYGRQLDVKQGSIWIGKIHKSECMLVMLKGRVAMANPGEPTEIWTAPCVRVSPAGTKRALVVLEDSVFVAIHPNPKNLRDLKDLEEEFISRSFFELEHILEHQP